MARWLGNWPSLGLRQALTKSLLHGRRQERRLARGLGDGQHLGHTSARGGVQLAPYSIAIHPEEVCHLTAGAGLLGLEQIQRL